LPEFYSNLTRILLGNFKWRARDGTTNTNDGQSEMGSSGSPPLATFLEYLSLLQQDMKDESKRTSTLLAFSILTLIAEGKNRTH